jgi:hypothetical protein
MPGQSDSSDLGSILSSEKARLTQKKQEIDDAVNGQNRMIQFNNSYNQRYIYYLKIMIIIVLTLVLFFGLKYAGETADFIPGWIIDICNVVVFSLAFFGIYYTTVDILRRDNMDFNEIKAPSPQTLTTDEIAARQAAAAASGNLLGTLGGSNCSGISCCGTDTMWDTTTNLCHMPGYKYGATPAAGSTGSAPVGFSPTSAPAGFSPTSAPAGFSRTSAPAGFSPTGAPMG